MRRGRSAYGYLAAFLIVILCIVGGHSCAVYLQ
jgi:hypothetical protein